MAGLQNVSGSTLSLSVAAAYNRFNNDPPYMGHFGWIATHAGRLCRVVDVRCTFLQHCAA